MHKKRVERLHFLEELFKSGKKFSFKELQLLVAEKFVPIKERMLRQDLSLLRETGMHGVPLNIKELNNQYYLSNEFVFNAKSLNEYERATLPFLFGLLEPYRKIPSVHALLNTLIETHKLNQEEVNKASIVFDVKEPKASPKWMKALNEIFLAINNQCAIEFYYKKVDKGGEVRDENLMEYITLFPLQVRFYQGLYYLIGIKTASEISPENLRLFRIDRIHRGPDFLLDEYTELPIYFDWNKFYHKAELFNYYEHCIGILRNYHVHKQPVRVYRWFRSWAASLVLALPLHSSQEIVQILENGDVQIRLLVYDTEELKGVFLRFGNDSWE